MYNSTLYIHSSQSPLAQPNLEYFYHFNRNLIPFSYDTFIAGKTLSNHQFTITMNLPILAISYKWRESIVLKDNSLSR
jgi:hypothetical protein